jgi:hypothetical protein
MSAQSIEQPYPIFTDADGDPLENGYIWIGVENLNPITDPVAVYWDSALTQPAVQPIRTQGGYPVNAGTPARLYTASSYSILVQDRNGITVYSAQSETVLINSDAVTFLQAGTGAVTRTAQAKMRETVSVKDFGAVGNGATDDTVAIQAAATYISANGGTLFFPRGVYLLTGFFNISGSNVRVTGEGMGASVIKVGAWVDGIRVSDGYPSPTSVLTNITIENLTIDGNRTGYVNGPNDTYGNGVNVNACDNVVIRNVEVKDAAEQGIVSTYWQVPALRIQQSVVIDSCLVSNPSANRIAIGIEGRGRSAKVTNNTVSFSNASVVAIYVGHASGAGTDNGFSVVANNVVNGSGVGSVGVRVTDNMYNVTVANNAISGCDISIRCSSDAQSTFGYTVIGNQCIDWATGGILVWPMFGAETALSIVANNRIFATSPSATSYGIIAAGKTNCIGNIIGSAQTAGITINGDNCIVSGNDIDNPAGFSIDFGTSAGSYVVGNKISRDVNISASSTFFMNIGASIERTSKLNLGTSTFVSGTVAPTTGTWARGDRVFNGQPAVGQPKSWACTVAGTPGTWVSEGNL